MNLPTKAFPALWLALLLLCTFLLYLPGLNGNFILDDYGNIVDNANVHMTTFGFTELLTALDSGVATVLQRPLSMLSFALNHVFTGMDPYAFKLTNLFIHLITATGVYLLVRELARAKICEEDGRIAQYFALFVTAYWTLHPLNVSTVLYIVQRMTQLATLAVIATLYFYCRIRANPLISKRKATATIALLGLMTMAGILFKENAVLIPVFILAIELFIFKFSCGTEIDRWFFKLFFTSFLALPAIGAIGILLLNPSLVIGDYSLRPFTMMERLLTESRVLWSYIQWLLLPDTRSLTFFHDNYEVSRSLFDPPSTLVAILALAALLAFCWRFRCRWPLACFGIAFFLVGHLLESTFLNLELVFEHRNYLPSVGAILVPGQVIFSMSDKYMSKTVVRSVIASILLLLAQSLYLETKKWSNSFEHARHIVESSPDSHRANYSLAMLYSLSANLVDDQKTSLERARHYYLQAARLDSFAVRGHLGYILSQAELGEEIDPAIFQEMVDRLEVSQLMRDGFTEISSITDCWYSGRCQFPQSMLVSMYNAIGRNTRTDPIIIQGILDQVGTALITIFNRPGDGKALLYLARSKREEVTIVDLKLIQLEIQDGHIAEARKLVDTALESKTLSLRAELEDLAELIDTLNAHQ